MSISVDTNSEIGHNSKTLVAEERLRSLVGRIERLNEEKKALASDIKDIYQEAKSAGFDAKALRRLISLRNKEPADLEEEAALIQIYAKALGMQLELPF